jgi:steroid delta-isomerase-like uncharacterized protein
MNTTTTEEAKERTREANERIFNQQDIEYIDDRYAESIVMHNVAQGVDYEGREAFKQWVTDLFETFPDFEAELTDIIVGEEKIVTQYVARGTHKGPMPGFDIEPTNKSVEFEGVTVHTMDGNQATEAWWYYDQLSFLTQLGLVPETAPTQ